MNDPTNDDSCSTPLDAMLASILVDALAATGGVGCLPGCTAPVLDDAFVHTCTAPVGVLRDAARGEVEVSVIRHLAVDYVRPPEIELISFAYVLPARGRRRRQVAAAPRPAPWERRVDGVMRFPLDQARRLLSLLTAAVTEPGVTP